MGRAENLATIEKFYDAFSRRDGDAMAACYSSDASFSDPVFPDLRGEEPGAMWRMLTSRSADLKVVLAEHHVDDRTGDAFWVATYTFTQTGRAVTNRVRSTFRFDDAGRIVEQRDDFDFHRWSRQALGLPGLLLGWTPIIQNAVRAKAAAGLRAFTSA